MTVIVVLSARPPASPSTSHTSMANILLLDDSSVAGCAMKGILARGKHHCHVASDATAAWRILREGAVFDLVFLEPKLGSSDGIAFLQRMREDWLLRYVPVVVYTSETAKFQVKRVL